jgi:hypothetical protein
MENLTDGRTKPTRQPRCETLMSVNLAAGNGPPMMLPGRSARAWFGLLARWLIAGGVFYFLIPVVGLLLPPSIRFAGMAFVGSIAFFCAGVAFVALIGAWRTSHREVDANYTTLYGRYAQLWQLDDRTGDVLSRPGEKSVHRPRL